MQTFEIKGDWMDGNGVLAGQRDRLLVHVADGVPFDAILYDDVKASAMPRACTLTPMVSFADGRRPASRPMPANLTGPAPQPPERRHR